mgnify:FL=1
MKVVRDIESRSLKEKNWSSASVGQLTRITEHLNEKDKPE